MQDLNDLYYYARVVEHGGFAPGARAGHAQVQAVAAVSRVGL
jgi:hypothetical protein